MRTAEIKRETKETKISVILNLDGSGKANIATGIGFFDHMLTAFATHSGIDLEVKAVGDTNVDTHHTVEDTGILIGKAIKTALGDKKGIVRFADCNIPMDEALGFCALDISGRGHLEFFARFNHKNIGDFESDSCEEFFRALALNAEITLHLRAVYGNNDHHIAEALFKATARCFRTALKVEGKSIPSTKGSL
ncbi:MAG: imidazoleglycerol-phosphate dehydratase HisB [Firmicutes bacterium]|nr:imidazoleglycerol-phosphate dehydratase HisB [Bacillota bacterium]